MVFFLFPYQEQRSYQGCHDFRHDDGAPDSIQSQDEGQRENRRALEHHGTQEGNQG